MRVDKLSISFEKLSNAVRSAAGKAGKPVSSWLAEAAASKLANLARLLRAVEVRTVDEATGRAAGVLLGSTRTADAVDATVVLLAGPGDRILTTDPQDLTALAAAAANRAVIVAC